jgi:hypothetical protein
MKVAEKSKQRKIRRKATEAILVYDLTTKLPMGQIIDLSAKGLKLMSELSVKVSKVYYCRIPLKNKINGFDEVLFDAECRWCRQNKDTGWYDSGYILRYPRPEYADVVKEMTRIWMMDGNDKLSASRRKSKEKKRGFFQNLFKS